MKSTGGGALAGQGSLLPPFEVVAALSGTIGYGAVAQCM